MSVAADVGNYCEDIRQRDHLRHLSYSDMRQQTDERVPERFERSAGRRLIPSATSRSRRAANTGFCREATHE